MGWLKALEVRAPALLLFVVMLAMFAFGMSYQHHVESRVPKIVIQPHCAPSPRDEMRVPTLPGRTRQIEA